MGLVIRGKWDNDASVASNAEGHWRHCPAKTRVHRKQNVLWLKTAYPRQKGVHSQGIARPPADILLARTGKAPELRIIGKKIARASKPSTPDTGSSSPNLSFPLIEAPHRSSLLLLPRRISSHSIPSG